MALAALEQRKEEEIKSAESRLYSQHRLVDIYLLAWWYIAKMAGRNIQTVTPTIGGARN